MIVWSFSSCQKEEFPEVTTCISEKVKEFKKRSLAKDINSYHFNGRIVFVFSDSHENCNDCGAAVYDENCEAICYLGGIGGFVECEEMNFSENAVHMNLIWSK